jgi:hypothetical protein
LVTSSVVVVVVIMSRLYQYSFVAYMYLDPILLDVTLSGRGCLHLVAVVTRLISFDFDFSDCKSHHKLEPSLLLSSQHPS